MIFFHLTDEKSTKLMKIFSSLHDRSFCIFTVHEMIETWLYLCDESFLICRDVERFGDDEVGVGP